MNALEKTFKSRVQTSLNTLKNIWYFKASARSVRGIPDMIICLNGFFIAIELKRDAKATVAKLQTYTSGKIKEKGKGLAFIAYPENWEGIFSILKEIDGV